MDCGDSISPPFIFLPLGSDSYEMIVLRGVQSGL